MLVYWLIVFVCSWVVGRLIGCLLCKVEMRISGTSGFVLFLVSITFGFIFLTYYFDKSSASNEPEVKDLRSSANTNSVLKHTFVVSQAIDAEQLGILAQFTDVELRQVVCFIVAKQGAMELILAQDYYLRYHYVVDGEVRRVIVLLPSLHCLGLGDESSLNDESSADGVVFM